MMRKDQQTGETECIGSKQEYSETDAKKVKKEIRKDLQEGQGAMTSREAGSIRE